MLHAVLDQLGQLLALGAPIQVEALLRDALGAAGELGVLPAQTAGPLHALLPQQRVLRLVAGGGVPVGRLFPPRLAARLALPLSGLHVDGHLGLQGEEEGGRVKATTATAGAFAVCSSHENKRAIKQRPMVFSHMREYVLPVRARPCTVRGQTHTQTKEMQ